MEAGSVRLLAALFVLFEFFVLSWESPRRSREKEITEFCVNPSDGDVIFTFMGSHENSGSRTAQCRYQRIGY